MRFSCAPGFTGLIFPYLVARRVGLAFILPTPSEEGKKAKRYQPSIFQSLGNIPRITRSPDQVSRKLFFDPLYGLRDSNSIVM